MNPCGFHAREPLALAGPQLGSPRSHLPAGLRQQLPVWPNGFLLVESDQGVQRGVRYVVPRKDESPVVRELHHEVTAAGLGSAETLLGLGCSHCA